ncbi:nuclear localization sequence binding protein [Gurleya vavrai]
MASKKVTKQEKKSLSSDSDSSSNSSTSSNPQESNSSSSAREEIVEKKRVKESSSEEEKAAGSDSSSSSSSENSSSENEEDTSSSSEDSSSEEKVKKKVDTKKIMDRVETNAETAGRCVFMKNFDGKLKKEEINAEIEKIGEIDILRVPVRRNETFNRGFLIVVFKKKESVAEALKLNGTQFLGCKIYVEELKDGMKKKENYEEERGEKRSEHKETKDPGQKSIIFAGNLPYEIDEFKFKKFIESKGKVYGVRLPQDKETGRKRGFAFIEFSTRNEMEEFLKLDLKYDDRKIHMKISEERKGNDDRRNDGRRMERGNDDRRGNNDSRGNNDRRIERGSYERKDNRRNDDRRGNNDRRENDKRGGNGDFKKKRFDDSRNNKENNSKKVKFEDSDE